MTTLDYLKLKEVVKRESKVIIKVDNFNTNNKVKNYNELQAQIAVSEYPTAQVTIDIEALRLKTEDKQQYTELVQCGCF